MAHVAPFASHVFLQLVCFQVNRATFLFQEPKKGDGPCCLVFWVVEGNLPVCPLQTGCSRVTFRLFGATLIPTKLLILAGYGYSSPPYRKGPNLKF